MRARERELLRKFRRVREFVKSTAAPLAGTRLNPSTARLDGVLHTLEGCATEQDLATRLSRAHTKRQASLAETLRSGHMLPITAIATAMEGHGAPDGLSRAVRCPHKRTSTEKLIIAAKGMANAAAPHAEWFAGIGLRENFLVELRRAIRELEEVAKERDEIMRRKTESSAAIQNNLRAGKRLVRQFSAVLRPLLREQHDLEASWRSITRTSRAPSSRREATAH